MAEEANARFKIRNGNGHSPSSLLAAELALRTDTSWLYVGEANQTPNLLYGQNIVPLERQVLNGNLQLTIQNKRFQFIDPNGSDRSVVLPIQTVIGLIFTIRNVGTSGDLIIKEGATTIGRLGESSYNNIKSGKEGVFIFDGVNWEVTFYG